MILKEEDYVGGLMQWAGNKMKAAKDTALAVAGSNQAVGRLNIRAVTDALIADWKRFANERKQGGVGGYDPYDPTMSQIEEFLSRRYGIDAGNIVDDPKVAAAAEAAGIQDDDDGTDLKATTPNEIEHLKRLATGDNVRAAGKPGPAKPRNPAAAHLRDKMNAEIENDKKNGVQTRESVELTEAGRGNHLRNVFSTIALSLWDAGLVSVDRGVGATKGGVPRRTNHSVHGVKQATGGDNEADDAADAEAGTSIETRVDNNGTFLNAVKMREGLIKQGVDGQMIGLLKNALKNGGGPYEAFSQANDDQKRKMVIIAAVTVASLQKAKSTMTAGENITRDGNTINFNAFKKALVKYEIKDRDIAMAMNRLKKAISDGKIDEDDVKTVMGGNDDTAQAVLGIMAASVTAISGVGKPEPEAKPEPAPAAPEGSEKKAEAE